MTPVILDSQLYKNLFLLHQEYIIGEIKILRNLKTYYYNVQMSTWDSKMIIIKDYAVGFVWTRDKDHFNNS